MLFYTFYQRVPRGTRVFDIFKDYSAEVGAHALWADALMVLGTYAGARLAVRGTHDTQLLARDVEVAAELRVRRLQAECLLLRQANVDKW